MELLRQLSPADPLRFQSFLPPLPGLLYLLASCPWLNRFFLRALACRRNESARPRRRNLCRCQIPAQSTRLRHSTLAVSLPKWAAAISVRPGGNRRRCNRRPVRQTPPEAWGNFPRSRARRRAAFRFSLRFLFGFCRPAISGWLRTFRRAGWDRALPSRRAFLWERIRQDRAGRGRGGGRFSPPLRWGLRRRGRDQRLLWLCCRRQPRRFRP